MTPEINLKLTELECLLINEEDPEYLECSYQEVDNQGFIYILLSKPEYKYYNLSERIYSIFDVLKFYASDILEEFPIIVECLDSNELTGLFKYYTK